MSEQPFDALARRTATAISRRQSLFSLAAGAALAALARPTLFAAKKGKGKKNKKKAGRCKPNQTKCGKACCTANQTCIGGSCLEPCRLAIDDEGPIKTMTLDADCVASQTITVGDQFTFDGDGKTIHMTGSSTDYQSVTVAEFDVRAGLLIVGAGSIKNLTIDQDALECEGPQAHSAIAMAGAQGDIENVTIVVTQGNAQCYRGITAAAAAADGVINIRNATITGPRNTGLSVSGSAPGSAVRGEVRDCTIRDALFGMFLSETGRQPPSELFQVTGNTVENVDVGVTIGGFPANVFFDDNTIEGENGATNLFGVNFGDDTKGVVSNSSFTDFTCGISLQQGSDVTVSNNNTFTSNTTNVCDPP